MSVISVTSANYKTELLCAGMPVLVGFWSDWCAPCKTLSPEVAEIASERPERKICAVNVDEQPELAQLFNIISTPTLTLLQDGRIIHTAVGVLSKREILDLLDR